MNRLLIYGFLLFTLILLGACKKKEGCTNPNALNYNPSAETNDGSCEYEATSTQSFVVKSGSISANETWTANNMYKLIGTIYVENGVTLTIEAGTIIKGDEGSGTLSSKLVVRQGGKINAIGTPQEPIIFTSILDNIQSGQLSGSNLNDNDRGLWGGIFICGYAPISHQFGDVIGEAYTLPIETYTDYGGSNVSDDSGVLQYVSIRHAGALIGTGQQCNGLTLAGVGSQTQVSNIEMFAGLGDGVSLLGGTVDISNVAIGFHSDDAIDIDENYSGSISNFVIVTNDISDNIIEADGPKGSTYTSGLFSVMNGEVINIGSNVKSAQFKERAQGNVQEVNFNGEIKIEAFYDGACINHLESAFTHLTDVSPSLIFTSSEHQGVLVTANCSVNPSDQLAAENQIISSAATGCNTAVFSSWTVLNMLGYF